RVQRHRLRQRRVQRDGWRGRDRTRDRRHGHAERKRQVRNRDDRPAWDARRRVVRHDDHVEGPPRIMATAAHELLARVRRAAWPTVRRLRNDEMGFGLIELLMAMGVLAIAISAQLAVFSSSYTSLSRANMKGTAVTMADKQMETYRTLPYSCVYLTSA